LQIAEVQITEARINNHLLSQPCSKRLDYREYWRGLEKEEDIQSRGEG
jgi:hypothetical protein